MQQHPSATHVFPSEKELDRVLGALSILTLLMTIPQIWTIWIGHQAAGVSLFTWSAYLLSALVWFWHGFRKHDKNIYLPCVGWVVMDCLVIVGAIIYR